MTRAQRVVGIIAGGFLTLSAFAHSILGGRAILAEMTAANVPADLLRGALVGWEFGGVAMLAFGVLVLRAFASRRVSASGDSGLATVRVIAASYVLFGSAAFLYSDFDPFFLVFVLPGWMLAYAGWRGASGAGRAA